MPYDYTDAPPPRAPDLIPDTTATISMHIRAGGIGEDGMYKRSGNGECEGLELEFTVIDGPYKGRKFWDNFLLLVGTTDGQKAMADTNRLILKAILDSSLGLDPNDKSAEARAARTVSIRRFDGMPFIGRIGVEKGGPNKNGGFWPDKNCLAGVITKDMREWYPVEQPPPFNGGGAPPASAPPQSAPPVQRPGWAQS
jgi:hypothetical protein